MTETEAMLRRQTEWQKSRRALTWPEKIRMAERIRDSIRTLRTHAKPGMTLAPLDIGRRPPGDLTGKPAGARSSESPR